MKKIYHLSSCNTCSRILGELQPSEEVVLQDIKTAPLTLAQLEALRDLTDSYEALFSRRAQLYRKKGLADQVLTEADYKRLILEHYTFLKRPVIIVNDRVFIGNSKKVVAEAKKALAS